MNLCLTSLSVRMTNIQTKCTKKSFYFIIYFFGATYNNCMPTTKYGHSLLLHSLNSSRNKRNNWKTLAFYNTRPCEHLLLCSLNGRGLRGCC